MAGESPVCSPSCTRPSFFFKRSVRIFGPMLYCSSPAVRVSDSITTLRFHQDQLNTLMFYHKENESSPHEIVSRKKTRLTHTQFLRASVVVSSVAVRGRPNPRTGARAMKFEIANLAVAAIATLGVMAGGATAAHAAEQDIVDTAVAAGPFQSLAAALGGAGLRL